MKILKKIAFAILPFLYLFCFNTSVTFGQLPNALRGYWPFDGNALDMSGNNNDGTNHGATLTEDRFGQPDMAYSFDGIDDYIVTAFADISGDSSRSISLWVKIPSLGNPITTSGYEIFSYGDNPGTAPGGSFRLVVNRNCYGVGVNIGSAVKVTTNTLSTLDEWHHYVIIYDKTVSPELNEIKIYLDGNLVANVNCEIYNVSTTVNTQINQPIHFGRLFLANDGRYFKGCLDDFRLISRAITEAEVTELFLHNRLDVESIKNDFSMTLFPNPANDILNFQGENERVKYIRIETLDGKITALSEFTKNMDISQLNTGLYFISFLDENKLVLGNSKFRKL